MKISVEVFNPKKTFKRIFSDDVRKYAHTRLHAYSLHKEASLSYLI